MRIAFLLPKIDLAGGIFIVLEHARGLATRHGHDVLIVTTDGQVITHDFPSLSELTRVGIDDVAGEQFDLAIATWWHTAYSLPRLVAPRYALFIQNLEDRFYTVTDVAARAGAAAVQMLPLTYITTAGWLEDQLRALRPDAAVHCVRSGIDKDIFHRASGARSVDTGPLRITVEGPPDVWFKGVPDALDAVRLMREPRHLTVVTGDRAATKEIHALADRVTGRLSHAGMADIFRETDVLLKLSRLEGMSGPPLEAFHCGATAVMTPMTGHEEYAEHAVNCMIVGYDDTVGTARTLDLLSRDRTFLSQLQDSALTAADRWPDWEQATRRFDEVIADILAAPPASDPRYVRRLINETYTNYLREPTVIAHTVAEPTFGEQFRWVWQHEGPSGIAKRIVRRLQIPGMRRSERDPAAPTERADASGGASTTEASPASPECSDRSDDGRQLAGTDWLDEESRLIFLFDYGLRPGDVVVDAGAGTGEEVLSFSRLVGPDGKVVAVEAHPKAFEELREFCEMHHLRNVELVNAALASQSGAVKITDLAEPELNSTVKEAGTIPVNAVTLDDLIRKLGIHRIDFLKMNIEGAEVDALQGFERGLRQTHHLCVGCHDFLADDERGGDEMRTKERVRRLLEQSGFVVQSQAHELPWIADYLYGTATWLAGSESAPGHDVVARGATERLCS